MERSGDGELGSSLTTLMETVHLQILMEITVEMVILTHQVEPPISA